MLATVISATDLTLWNSVPERTFRSYDVLTVDGKLHSVSEFNVTDAAGSTRRTPQVGQRGELREVTQNGYDLVLCLDDQQEVPIAQ